MEQAECALRLRGVFFLLFGVFVGGCDTNSPLMILQNQALLAGGASDPCRWSTNPNDSVPRGNLDVGLTDRYVLHPLFRNAPLPGTVLDLSLADGFQLVGADIELHLNTADGPLLNLGNATLSQYTIASSGFFRPPRAGESPLMVGELEVIPSNIGQALRARLCRIQPPPAGLICNRQPVTSTILSVVIVVRPFGSTLAGGSFTGAQFEYPVDVSCGTSVRFPSDSRDPSLTGNNCLAPGADRMRRCAIGQDAPTDCRLCVGNNPLCTPLECR